MPVLFSRMRRRRRGNSQATTRFGPLEQLIKAEFNTGEAMTVLEAADHMGVGLALRVIPLWLTDQIKASNLLLTDPFGHSAA